ncbi:hypothetical protein Hanom_Chr09g00834441 [Helianthus anomalus]
MTRVKTLLDEIFRGVTVTVVEGVDKAMELSRWKWSFLMPLPLLIVVLKLPLKIRKQSSRSALQIEQVKARMFNFSD